MNETGSNSDSKVQRGLVAGAALVGVGALIWLSSQGSSYPDWFLGVLLGLTTINLANWIFEAKASAPKARCKNCGAMRVVDDGSVCLCGTGEVFMPWLNRLALGLIVLLLGTIGVSSLWAALTDSSNKSRGKGIGLGVVMTALAITTAAEIMGYHVLRRLRRTLGGRFPYDFEQDIKRLKLQRHLAIRVILLVVSVAVFAASVMYLLRHP